MFGTCVQICEEINASSFLEATPRSEIVVSQSTKDDWFIRVSLISELADELPTGLSQGNDDAENVSASIL